MVAARKDDDGGSLYAAIGAFLDAHCLGADPAHYAFAHAALTDPAIGIAVARLTDGGVRLGRREIEQLGGVVRPRGGDASTQRRCADDLVARTRAQVDDFAIMVRDLRAETSVFGRDLAESAAELSRQPSIEGLDEIARITGAMTARVRDTEARLAKVTAEADALRLQLSQAQGEARRDPLTGLPNRLAFEEAFLQAGSDDTPVCLAAAYIACFKGFDDRLGHGFDAGCHRNRAWADRRML